MSHFLKMSTAAHDILNLKKIHVYNLQIWQTDYIRYFEGILPPQWEIIDVERDAMPLGHMILPYEQPGIMISFAGPTVLKLVQHAQYGPESFFLWFMPLPYQGRGSDILTQRAARLLGLAPAHAVYGYQNTLKVPTWPNWQNEIVKLLRLRAPRTNSDLSEKKKSPAN